MILFFVGFQNVGENKAEKNKEISLKDKSTIKSFEVDTLNKFQFRTKKGDVIKISYQNDTIRILFNDKASLINIPYTAPIENVVPCNCLAIKKKIYLFIKIIFFIGTQFCYCQSMILTEE
jgi:hypothetical protein